jgi:alanyl aminopeptidase
MNARMLGMLCAVLCACGSTPPPVPSPPPALPPPPPAAVPLAEEPVPALRLPQDTRPLAESVEMQLDPRQERFSGAVDIDVRLDRPRAVVWLHGKDMHVTAATVTPTGGAPLAATWQERGDSGMASLAVAGVIPAGTARLHVVFDAPYGRGQKGLYKTREADVDYVFTQFEAIGARLAFPCFDKPGFKIPFTTTLVVPAEMRAVANTQEVSRAVDGGQVRVHFAPTLPLPSYLVAFAAGTLDIVAVPDVPPNAVRTRPLPLRGVAPHGRGKDMTYALAHTGEIVAALEAYFGIEYPWDKLDILAVPGKGGAMENAGAITFGERLVLFDAATAPVGQRRGYASVMTHELAHQWTGDLVTMAWWDDTWLNEAFATWVAAKVGQSWDPKLHLDVSALRGVQGAMGTDAMVSARSIRQPIASAHDIENAFDSITYQKGGGVLAMFERFAGADAWRKGLHAYLQSHRFGNATADDFLDAENAATGKDVKTAFHTFLDQPGVPFLEVSTDCTTSNPSHDRRANMPGSAHIHVKQSRYLPVGSTGNANVTWQVPFCWRDRSGDSCRLLTQAETDIDLGGQAVCPLDVFPNVDGAGYYRFSLTPKDLAAVRAGLGRLSIREKITYASSLRSAFARATTPMKDVVVAVAPLAEDPDPAIAEEPMGYLTQGRDWLFTTPLRGNVEAYGRRLYAPVARRLGWDVKRGEDDETRTLRGSVLGFLTATGRDAAVRAEARKRGLAYLGVGKDGVIHPEVLDPNLVGVALGVVGEEADRATWDAMKALLVGSVDETLRQRLVSALGSAREPKLAAAARELVLDPALRDTEILAPLWAQLSQPDMRDTAWAWVKEHYDAILTRLPKHHGGVQIVSTGRSYCDEAHARDAEAFFAPKIESIEGGPRALAQALEDVRLCAARRTAQDASARELFAGRR